MSQRRLLLISVVVAALFVAAAASAGTTTYTFNAIEELTAVSGPGGSASYSYDGDGQRIKRTAGGQTVIYVRDPSGQVIAEYSSGGTLLVEYVYVDGKRLCKITKDAQGVEHRVYYHTDVVGTPVALTSETGSVTGTAQYRPFGELAGTALPDPHSFTGKELDPETGLHYFGARYYDAHLGRFVSVDPVGGNIGNPQTWNRYSYALDNPFRFQDPDGRIVDVVADIGFIVLDVTDIAGSMIAGDSTTTTQWLALGGDALAAAVPFVTGAGLAIRAAAKAEHAVDATRAAERVAEGTRAAGAAARAREASKIDRAAFRSEREAFWKAEAKANPGKYTPDDLDRMGAGKAPKGGDGHSMELHHVDGTPTGGTEPLSRTDHRLGDNCLENHPWLGGDK